MKRHSRGDEQGGHGSKNEEQEQFGSHPGHRALPLPLRGAPGAPAPPNGNSPTFRRHFFIASTSLVHVLQRWQSGWQHRRRERRPA